MPADDWCVHATVVKLAAEAAVVVVLGVLDPAATGDGASRSEPDRVPTAVVLVTPDAARPVASRPAAATPGAVTPGAVTPAAATVSVEVGGGPLTVLGDVQPVELHEITPGHYVGQVRGIRLVDARGTDAGWQLSVRFTTAGPGVAHVRVDRVDAFAASTVGIAGRDATLRDTAPGVVVTAAPGNSGGAFDVSLKVAWDAGNAKSSPPKLDGLLSLRAA